MKGKMADTYSYVSGELRCALFRLFVDGILRNTNKKKFSKWSHQNIFARFFVSNRPKLLLFSNKRKKVKIGQNAFTLNQGDTPLIESNDFAVQHRILIKWIESKTKQIRTETRQLPETYKQTTIKLPFLQSKKFGGSPTEWKAFWDAFASAIDNNTDLENIQKLNYLKLYLYGNAARAIDGFQATNEHYERAVRQLEERFGDLQVMVSGHMNQFKEIKPVQNIMDINGLRELFDKLETNVRSLEGIVVQTETCEAILTPEILKKLPEQLRILITRKLPDSWDLRLLLKIFREELQVREKCRFALENKATINTPPTRSYARQSHATTAALYSDSVGNSRSFRITCAFCANEHYSRNCEVVTDHNARRKILHRKGKCYICLRSGHLSRDCRSQIYCYKCKGRHHTTICDSYSKQSDKKEVTSQQKSHNQTASKVQAKTQTTTNLHVSSENSILLQTARKSRFSRRRKEI